MRVFVLLFNAGTDNEGIHTIEIGDRNIVLMFEEIEEFCEEAGYHCELIPENFRPETDYDRLLLSPPESNRDAFDWDKEERRPVVSADDEPEMSQSELDAMRRRMEGLL
jgi:Protein of unknown function (DUF3110)